MRKLHPFDRKNNRYISLATDLKHITGVVNKSLYCSATYSDTSLTIKSLKEGKINILFKGVLNINDEIAYILITITIDERGFISYDDTFYIFSKPLDFDKGPSTIQKDFHTYSSLGDLDISEPEDDPNVVPCVDINHINSQYFLKLTKSNISI